MSTLTVTSKGQVTLRKELLGHLGVKPGQRVDVEVLLADYETLLGGQAATSLTTGIPSIACWQPRRNSIS
ncbi:MULTISPECIES: AbrB/MazE/SpoVT family DNA-binding domain-containing protein [unclassified Synechococcus]|uniref:AbrB/MazE/SpoVT family DNA-binding domain-containing protein n=1 Tax=unclassified Synechococcus TaxID=2626047 RepID=UPI0021A371FE|nr:MULTISPECIES: AbrB/MazE/SpoVT family DNA-binding domain-containing protein [unclassified Synechococcus]MCT0212358.1 AbrB/MazE/SpoVT family DNA-binding domain-containing protein [Synechococcus sp. CS-1326]MCT0234229.1 AbrB/MazE/SpoVT family DNA-binding domain-containing protein [Synechococcus sp. CS-1327]